MGDVKLSAEVVGLCAQITSSWLLLSNGYFQTGKGWMAFSESSSPRSVAEKNFAAAVSALENKIGGK